MLLLRPSSIERTSMFVALGTSGRPPQEGDRWRWHDPNRCVRIGPVHINQGKKLTVGNVDCVGHPLHCGRALPDIVADVTVGDDRVGIRQYGVDEWIVVGDPYNEPLDPI
jgi:hypothetical protein